jgi:hypothetical protein
MDPGLGEPCDWQGYATAKWIVREGAADQLDPDRIAIPVAQAIAFLRKVLHGAYG